MVRLSLMWNSEGNGVQKNKWSERKGGLSSGSLSTTQWCKLMMKRSLTGEQKQWFPLFHSVNPIASK